jgi:hypothetical protein
MDMFDGVGRRQDEVSGQFLDIGQHSLNGRERNVLFRNNGDGSFLDVAWVNDADRIEDGRGLSVIDVDGDGRLDLVLRNYRQPAVVLRNVGPGGHWIEFALTGVRSNRDAVGARLRVRSGKRWQTREVTPAQFLSGAISSSTGLAPTPRPTGGDPRAGAARARTAADRSHVVEGRFECSTLNEGASVPPVQAVGSMSTLATVPFCSSWLPPKKSTRPMPR